MGEKVTTIMVLKVDLKCRRCYKKVKKILCKIPQIQDQIYDEKQNTVTIKVVCCSPEKIKQKIICKGGDSIKGIGPPPPPKTKEEKPKEDKPKEEKPKEAEKPKPAPEKPKEPEKPKPAPAPEKPKKAEPEKQKDVPDKPKKAEKPKPPPEKPPEALKPAPPPEPKPANLVLPACVPAYPLGVCCVPCYEGRPGGPCFQGHPPPYPSIYGRPVYGSYGCGCGCGGYRPCYVRGDYFSDENTSGCIVM